MSSPVPWLRPLQVVAISLGVVLAALLVAWMRMEPISAALKLGPAGARNETAAVSSPDLRHEAPGPTASLPDAARDVVSAAATPADSAAVLFGSVTREDRSPVTKGFLFLYRDDKHVGTAALRDGAFSFAGLHRGVHRLNTRIDDELPVEQDVVLAAATTRVDLVLAKPWLLTVNVVTPEGTPLLPEVQKAVSRPYLRSIVACACKEPMAGDLPPSNSAEVRTGVGAFRGGDPFGERGALPKQTLGVLTLPSIAPLHIALLLRNHVIAQLPASPGQTEITFTLGVEAFLARLASVRVRLVDAAGNPVAPATVALNDAQTGGGGKKVDAEGRATLDHLTPGRLDLEVGHATLRAPRVQVDVAPGANLDLGDIVLVPGVPVAFDLSNFEGKGSVWFHPLDPPRPGWTAKPGYVSLDNGKAQTHSLHPGRYGMYASATNGVAVLEVDASRAPPAPIRFDLRRGAPLRIEYAVTTGAVGLELWSETGLLVRRRNTTTSMRESVELPAGTYTAAITDAMGGTTRRTIRLTSAGASLVIP